MGSWRATWDQFHVAVIRDSTTPVQALPLTPLSLVKVASLFKKCGYSSFPNYLTTIRAAHIEDGYDWCQLLTHTGVRCARSVMRGIGPARESYAFDFGRLLALLRPWQPIANGGPVQPVQLALLASMFLLREVEVSNSMISAWACDRDL